MKTNEQLAASIERFQRGFWDCAAVDRPPVSIVPDALWQPIGFLRAPFDRTEVSPADPGPDLVRTEYDVVSDGRDVTSDDFMPYAAAWRGVPWLEAMCGCEVRYSTGSLAPHRFVESAELLRDVAIPANPAWLDRLCAETARLVETAPQDCWVSPSILRGCSDVLAAMRGLNEFCLDLHDNPAALHAAAARVNRLHLDVLDRHFATVPPKLGGYGSIYGYWAPAPTTVIQEDAMGLCSPALYRDLFQEYNAEIVRKMGSHTLFHLHSTGYRHYRHVMEIPNLAGLELTVESNGPRFDRLLPALVEILELTRLILFVDAHFEQLAAVLPKLPKEGLYLMISGKFISTEEEFREFVSANW